MWRCSYLFMVLFSLMLLVLHFSIKLQWWERIVKEKGETKWLIQWFASSWPDDASFADPSIPPNVLFALGELIMKIGELACGWCSLSALDQNPSVLHPLLFINWAQCVIPSVFCLTGWFLFSFLFFFFLVGKIGILKTPSPSQGPNEVPRLPDPNLIFPPTPRRYNAQQDSMLERPKTLEFLPRPRPSANRQRLDPRWYVSPDNTKGEFSANSSSTETPSHLDPYFTSSSSAVGDRPALLPFHVRLPEEKRTLLDVDVEGQSQDSTVPLCRTELKTHKPAVFEFKQEFRS